MKPKMVILIVVILIVMFIVGVGGGILNKGVPNADVDLISGFKSFFNERLKSPLDLNSMTLTSGSSPCLEGGRATLTPGTACVYHITKPQPSTLDLPLLPSITLPSQTVQSLSFDLVAGRCLGLLLDADDPNVMRAEIYIVAETLPPNTYANGHPCAKPSDPQVTIFKQGGNRLTLSCIEAITAEGCVVRFNPPSTD